MNIPTGRYFNVDPSVTLSNLPASTEQWMQIKPEILLLRNIWATQSVITLEGLEDVIYNRPNPYCDDEYPHFRKEHGRLWLIDGHHRCALLKMAGSERVIGRVSK